MEKVPVSLSEAKRAALRGEALCFEDGVIVEFNKPWKWHRHAAGERIRKIRDFCGGKVYLMVEAKE